MSIYDNLDRDAARAYEAGVLAERDRIARELDEIATRYSDAGVFARAVVSDVRKLVGAPGPAVVKEAGE